MPISCEVGTINLKNIYNRSISHFFEKCVPRPTSQNDRGFEKNDITLRFSAICSLNVLRLKIY